MPTVEGFARSDGDGRDATDVWRSAACGPQRRGTPPRRALERHRLDDHPGPGGPWSSARSHASGSAAGWAVGDERCMKASVLERWTGRRWTVSPAPNGGPGLRSLVGMAAITDSDVWVGGQRADVHDVKRTFAEHWTERSGKSFQRPTSAPERIRSTAWLPPRPTRCGWSAARRTSQPVSTAPSPSCGMASPGQSFRAPTRTSLTNHLQAVAARLRRGRVGRRALPHP